MPFTLYSTAMDTFVPMLRALSNILDKAAKHAEAKKFDSSVLVNARLAPDMFPLSKQIQIACDQAKNQSSRLAGKEPPVFEDNEKTIDELKARIAKTIDYLKTLPEAAFKGAEDRTINMPLRDPMHLDAQGDAFLRDWAFPNFYFHCATAYNILRHNGVELGKGDFLGNAGGLIKTK